MIVFLFQGCWGRYFESEPMAALMKLLPLNLKPFLLLSADLHICVAFPQICVLLLHGSNGKGIWLQSSQPWQHPLHKACVCWVSDSEAALWTMLMPGCRWSPSASSITAELQTFTSPIHIPWHHWNHEWRCAPKALVSYTDCSCMHQCYNNDNRHSLSFLLQGKKERGSKEAAE